MKRFLAYRNIITKKLPYSRYTDIEANIDQKRENDRVTLLSLIRLSAIQTNFLTLILVGFLGIRFEVGSGMGGKITTMSKNCYNYDRNFKFGT